MDLKNKNSIRVKVGEEYLGYTLARDVLKDRDLLLLSKGHVLDEEFIKTLKLNGVIHIYVVPEKKKLS